MAGNKPSDMPVANMKKLEKLIEGFKPSEIEIVKTIVMRDGRIRATKPRYQEDDSLMRKTAYVWRMVMFAVSPRPRFQSLPNNVYEDLPTKSRQDAIRMGDELQKIVDAIKEATPTQERHGEKNWRNIK